MAQQIGGKQQLTRAPTRARRQFLPEATASAEAAGQILTDRFGPQPWIDQVKSAVLNAVQNGIEILSRPAVSVNANPNDPYRFAARSAQELKESAHLVPGASAAELPPAEDEAPVPPPAKPRTTPPKARSSEWLL